jgi:hypothetical protein
MAMSKTKILGGVTAILIVLGTAFYLYSQLTAKRTAPVVEPGTSEANQVVTNPSPPPQPTPPKSQPGPTTTSTAPRPNDSEQTNSQLEEDLQGIQAGLDLLHNPLQ